MPLPLRPALSAVLLGEARVNVLRLNPGCWISSKVPVGDMMRFQ